MYQKLKGKVVLKHCTIKMYWSVSVIVKFSARWRLVVSGTLQQLGPWERSFQYPVDWSLVVSLLQLTGFLRLWPQETHLYGAQVMTGTASLGTQFWKVAISLGLAVSWVFSEWCLADTGMKSFPLLFHSIVACNYLNLFKNSGIVASYVFLDSMHIYSAIFLSYLDGSEWGCFICKWWCILLQFWLLPCFWRDISRRESWTSCIWRENSTIPL
jgi:hypothetical protein